MNAYTGHVMALPELQTAQGGSWWPAVGQPIGASDLPSEGSHSGEVGAQLAELREEVYSGAPIVVVSGNVGHAVALGRRELDRRARRRAAAKQARKRNR